MGGISQTTKNPQNRLKKWQAGPGMKNFRSFTRSLRSNFKVFESTFTKPPEFNKETVLKFQHILNFFPASPQGLQSNKVEI